MDLLTACAIAKKLMQDIKPACEKIAIAGSIRRKKHEVKDIEIVAIPIINSYDEVNLFGEKVRTQAIDLLEVLLETQLKDPSWSWEKDLKVLRWGPRYKRLHHKEHDISCDLFYAKVGSWGGAFTIRTGPADFSRGIVTFARDIGYHIADGYFLHKHPKPKDGCKAGERCKKIVACPTERIFFQQLGLSYIKPELRNEQTLREAIAKSKPYYGHSEFGY